MEAEWEAGNADDMLYPDSVFGFTADATTVPLMTDDIKDIPDLSLWGVRHAGWLHGRGDKTSSGQTSLESSIDSMSAVQDPRPIQTLWMPRAHPLYM